MYAAMRKDEGNAADGRFSVARIIERRLIWGEQD
jgi:hypothetical protein